MNAHLFRIEPLDGVQTARIHQSMSMPFSMEVLPQGAKTAVRVTGTLTISSAINFDPAAGKVVRSSVSGHGVLKAPPETGAAPDAEPQTMDFKVDVVAVLVK